MVTCSKDRILKPPRFNTKHPMAFIVHVDLIESNYSTKAYKHATNATWHQVMTKEYNSLIANSTWIIVPSSPHQHIIGYK